MNSTETLEALRAALAPRIIVLGPLGHGGMGEVFLGRDPALKRLVAIKVLSPRLALSEAACMRFRREAEAAAAVAHPSVVSIYETGELAAPPLPFFIMEHVDGRVLAEMYPPGVPAPESMVRRVIGDVSQALVTAHGRGVIHRDLKPRNIMVDNETGHAVVLDFGISAVVESPGAPGEQGITEAGSILGTPQYLSPEQATGTQVSDRSDIYSLSLVAFELLTGSSPFNAGTPVGMVLAHMHVAAPSVTIHRPDVDPLFARLIDQGLSKDPARRPSAREFANALAPTTAVIEWPPPGLEALREAGRRSLTLNVVLALLASVAMVGLLAQPTSVSLCCWMRPEESRVWQAFTWFSARFFNWGIRSVFESWYLLLQLLITAMFGVYIVFTLRLIDVIRELQRARRAGYVWAVLFATVTDWYPDTQQLFNGVGRFALLSATERGRVMLLRRWQALVAVVFPALCFLLPFGWLLGMHGSSSAPGVLTPGEAVFLVAPLVLGFLTIMALAFAERRMLPATGPQRRRRNPPISAALARGWMSVRQQVPIPDRGPYLAGAYTPLLSFLAIAAGLVTIAVSSGASLRAGSWVSRSKSVGSVWVDSLLQGRIEFESWHTLDSAVALVAARSNRLATADLDAARLLAASALRRSGRSGAPFELSGVSLPGSRPADLNGTLLGAAFRNLPSLLSPASRDSLALDTIPAELGWWRRFATSPSPPAGWYLAAGFPGAEKGFPRDLSVFTAPSGAMEGALRNRAAAIVRLSVGDRAGAVARFRENLAGARHFFASPISNDAGQGMVWVRISARDLGRVAGAIGDQQLQQESEALTALINRYNDLVNRFYDAAPLVLSVGASDVAVGLLGDARLAPSTRWTLAWGIVRSFCSSPREMVLGIDPRRRELLARAREYLRDIPRSDEYVDLMNRYLTNPGSTNQQQYKTLTLRLANSVLRGGLKDRVLFCSEVS